MTQFISQSNRGRSAFKITVASRHSPWCNLQHWFLISYRELQTATLQQYGKRLFLTLKIYFFTCTWGIICDKFCLNFKHNAELVTYNSWKCMWKNKSLMQKILQKDSRYTHVILLMLSEHKAQCIKLLLIKGNQLKICLDNLSIPYCRWIIILWTCGITWSGDKSRGIIY